MFGYLITNQKKGDCVDQIVSWIKSGEKRKYFVCANPHSLEMARSDRLFRQAINDADLVTPDGIGIVIASKLLGGNICERVTGSDIFKGLSHALSRQGRYRYFFLGSTERNLARIAEKMRREFPNIEVAGRFSPPFKSEFNCDENRAIVEAIEQARPDVLWVGMTAPKQEKWIYQHRDELDVKFIGAVGAVFDFYVGTVKRSHPWFQKHGLEWFPRLLRNPRRLWYRNFVSNPKFLIRVLMHRLIGNRL